MKRFIKVIILTFTSYHKNIYKNEGEIMLRVFCRGLGNCLHASVMKVIYFEIGKKLWKFIYGTCLFRNKKCLCLVLLSFVLYIFRNLTSKAWKLNSILQSLKFKNAAQKVILGEQSFWFRNISKQNVVFRSVNVSMLSRPSPPQQSPLYDLYLFCLSLKPIS